MSFDERLEGTATPDAAGEEEWFKPGDRLGGYEVVRVKDVGTFSYNLEVRDLVRSSHAVVHRRPDTASETLDGIRHETQLTHRALPVIMFVGEPCKESRGRVWFVREITPPPLANLVSTTGKPLPVEEVCLVGREVCDLLDYLHEASRHPELGVVVHGFLVPAYIHLLEGGRVVVAGTDVKFLIRAGHPLPERHRSYRCPECLDAAVDRLTPANDLWAVAGCLLYLATGRGPVEIGDADNMRAAHAAGAPQRRAAEVGHEGLRAVLVRALAPDPADRFQTPLEMRRALEAACSSPPPSPDAGRAPTRLEDYAFSSQSVVTYYPAPIAVAYRRFCAQKGHHARWMALIAAAEALVRYLVTVGVSDLFQCLARSAQTGAALPAGTEFDFLRKRTSMSFGEWVGALRATAAALAGQPNRRVEPLPRVCEDGGHLDKNLLRQIIEERNRWVHTGGNIVITEAEAKQSLELLRPKLEEALNAVRFVCRYPLGFFQRLTPEGDPAPLFALHSCMGTRVANTAEAFKFLADAPLVTDHPFVATPAGDVVMLLWPLLLQRVSDISHRHTLYVFETIDKRSGWLTKVDAAAIDVRNDIWPREMHDEPAVDHAWLLERLRRYLPHCALPPGLLLVEKLMPSRGRLVGMQLGPYHLRQMVATGGFGTIYLGETDRGEKVAVKVLESDDAVRQFGRFQREFDKLRSAGDPRIITCYENGRQLINGQVYPWYSMEFAVGGDLSTRIEERGPLPWEDPGQSEKLVRTFREVADEFLEVAAAVAHLHGLGIVHRDIKPSNVLILNEGKPCLSDFGLVKSLNPSLHSLREITSAGAVLGTPDYMAPEQKKGLEVDVTADVYALGVMLAELTTGRKPRPDTDVAQGSTLNNEPSLHALPDRLRRLILRCTDVASGKRPADVRRVREQFSQLKDVLTAGEQPMGEPFSQERPPA